MKLRNYWKEENVMSKTNREGTINNIEWLESEEKEKVRKAEKSKLKLELERLKMEKEKQSSVALYEMYNAVARCGEDFATDTYGIRLCHYATAMVYLCYKLRYIDRQTYKRLTDYLDIKTKKC